MRIEFFGLLLKCLPIGRIKEKKKKLRICETTFNFLPLYTNTCLNPDGARMSRYDSPIIRKEDNFFFLREREREGGGGTEREREREKIPSRFHA